MNRFDTTRAALLFIAFGATNAACLTPAYLASVPDGLADASTDGVADAMPPVDVPSDQPEHEDAGTQLRVEGTLAAENEASNAQSAMAFETRVMLHLERQGAVYSNATVTLTGASGTVTLALSGGAFVGSLRGYDANYTLDVVGEGESLHAALHGPAFHVFTAPQDGETRLADTPMTVSWSPAGAQAATIETTRLSEMPIADTGSYTIPGSALIGEAGQLELDRVRVRRRSAVPVPGASTDSAITFEVRNDVGFIVDAR